MDSTIFISFSDRVFRRDSGVGALLELILSIDEPPITTALYVRR